LNATQASDEEGREWIDTLEDENSRADLNVEEEHDQEKLADWIGVAMDSLNEREQFIVRERKLIENPRTLESLGTELSLSKERVRQLEAAAFGKMRKYLEKNAGEVRNFL
jgi:RNA polymerase sigma-32 factor